MELSPIWKDTFLQILREELIPAMGCTEPIAIALAAAKARHPAQELGTHRYIHESLKARPVHRQHRHLVYSYNHFQEFQK